MSLHGNPQQNKIMSTFSVHHVAQKKRKDHTRTHMMARAVYVKRHASFLDMPIKRLWKKHCTREKNEETICNEKRSNCFPVTFTILVL